mmetsp:Transcript_10514/g.25921  ORF Transcript_10514/g.25921 Transcript_10514/m.25921 type:complete len:1243 (-) Transcript_10514:279-4007(-)
MSEKLFSTVGSADFLKFDFGGKAYGAEIEGNIKKSGQTCAITVQEKTLSTGRKVVWMEHDFAFFGGSLGCAEGERLTLGFEHARKNKLPAVVKCASGGARMQEGTLSLMQMAKVSCAVEALQRDGLPFITLLVDPCYGGVSASYAMQSDVRIAAAKARIGFSGPAVILNTQFGMDQNAYDTECPQIFQTAEFGYQNGQVDIVTEKGDFPTMEAALEDKVAKCLDVLSPGKEDKVADPPAAAAKEGKVEMNYLKSRPLERYDADDVVAAITSSYEELGGDGKVGLDKCLRGGLAVLKSGRRCVIIKCGKGHSPAEREAHNHAMPSPAGYRTALRLFEMAERFSLPVVTLVDCVGAWPTFVAEAAGQSEAIATNLTKMAGLKVPIISIIIGEGGSGGALGVAMGNKVGMLSNAYYSTITPEGAASILGRYTDEAMKKEQFPKDCQALATLQHIYAPQLKDLGVIDEVIFEKEGEDCENFPQLAANLRHFVEAELAALAGKQAMELVEQRYQRFRGMGRFEERSVEDLAKIQVEKFEPKKRPPPGEVENATPLLQYLTKQTLKSAHSFYKGKGPANVPRNIAIPKPVGSRPTVVNAKTILDRDGPEAMAKWVRAQSKTRVLLTDTTFRDAHQSLLATRVRTVDFMACAEETSHQLADYFSIECWGGATFDVAYRFLNEDPWERLRRIREKVPNICTQMLLRGSNGLGYSSYPDNVVEACVDLAAKNGMDVFRIFDCFNDVEQMRISINAVRKVNKVAEVAMCFTGDFLSPDEKIYTLEYYKDLCKKCVDAGAHMIAIKDMAGLLKPRHAKPMVDVIRSVTDLPVHFHTHNTSSAQLGTLLAMADAGCDIVDGCTASMADGTSQPSLNAFVAAMEGHERDPKVNWRKLEALDNYWMRVRLMYSIFESGMKSGSARIYDHHIPGGQYSNLFAQCLSLGIGHRWEEVLDMYRDVNKWCGDIVKVTPSSKVVGDIALFLINKNLPATVLDDEDEMSKIDWPSSAIEMAMGYLGFPHMGFPEKMTRAILKGKKPLTVRPGEDLAAADFEAERKKLAEEIGRDVKDVSDEDLVGALLYPKVFRDYAKHMSTYGRGTPELPTPAFLYGMEVGETIKFTLDNGHKIGGTHEVKITLVRVGPLGFDDERVLTFDVNGVKLTVKCADPPSGKISYDGPMADKKDAAQVASPIMGVVANVPVEVGATVKKGDLLLVVSAMKMEISVKAPHDGKVEGLIARKDLEVVEGALLCKVVA